MTFYHNPEQKVEDAIKAYFEAKDLPIESIYLGHTEETIAEPCIFIVAVESDPEVIGATISGNWTTIVEISIRTNVGDTTRAEHGQYEAEIRDIIFCDDFKDQINANSTELNIMEMTPAKFSRGVEDHSRISTQEIELYLMPSDPA